jgi:copper chaperone CopZ
MKILQIRFSNKTVALMLFAILVTAMGVAGGYAISRTDTRQGLNRNSLENMPSLETSPVVSTREIASMVRGETQTPEKGLHGGTEDSISKVILNVDGMSCSGCVATIKSSLKRLQGINEIIVDVVRGKAEVYFNTQQLTEVDQIAKAITASGYPSRVWKTLSPEQIRAEQDRAAEKSQYYIASVGIWDITRSEFNTELGAAKKRYAKVYGKNVLTGPQGKIFLDRLKTQIVGGLINEGILMQEVKKADFNFDPGLVKKELDQLVQKHGTSLSGFKELLQENGYDFDYFIKKLENRISINQYLDEMVLVKVSNKMERQRLYAAWYKKARVLTDIVYYDKELERLVQGQGGGGSCCSGG